MHLFFSTLRYQEVPFRSVVFYKRDFKILQTKINILKCINSYVHWDVRIIIKKYKEQY